MIVKVKDYDFEVELSSIESALLRFRPVGQNYLWEHVTKIGEDWHYVEIKTGTTTGSISRSRYLENSYFVHHAGYQGLTRFYEDLVVEKELLLDEGND